MPAKETDADPLELARTLESYLGDHPGAVLYDDGRVLFDMATARYSLSAEHGRCVLHLWSEERNLIRTVVGLEQRKERLRIRVRRLGAPRPQSFDLAPDRDRRTPASREVARSAYLRIMERVLTRAFSDFQIKNLRSAMDLENSFGPAYARGILARGQQSWAVIGAGPAETQATIDGILTLGILWLAHCRRGDGGKTVFHGLKVFVPRGTGDVTRTRMAWLAPGLGAWELYEVGGDGDELMRLDISAEGNLKMRLTHAFDPQAAVARAQGGIDRLMRLLPEGMRTLVDIEAKGPNEVALALYGLEFARVRQGFQANSFARQDNVTFGVGVHETALDTASETWFADLAQRLFQHRRPGGNARDPLFRMQPERWLQAVLRRALIAIEPDFQSILYSQVPAFAAADRGVLDLLTVNQVGRLAVLELKADEDLQLPLQGLDYWIRVRQLNEERSGAAKAPNEFERSGYFPGIHLQSQPPLLYFVVPALRIHPSLETILAHLSPAIPWRLIAIGEDWRRERKVIFRKRS